jgi:hypothetical protein
LPRRGEVAAAPRFIDFHHLRIVEPMRNFVLVQHDFGIGKEATPGRVGKAVRMVGMHVGEQDGVDCVGRDAGRRKRPRQLPERRPHAVAGAGVDQRRAPGGLDQERVDADGQRHPAAVAADNRVRLGRRHIAHDIERRVEIAVAEHRDADVADGATMDARCVAADAHVL